jgi:hypothetical protein
MHLKYTLKWEFGLFHALDMYGIPKTLDLIAIILMYQNKVEIHIRNLLMNGISL